MYYKCLKSKFCGCQQNDIAAVSFLTPDYHDQGKYKMLPYKNQIGLNLAGNKVALAVKIHTFCQQQCCAQQDSTDA